MTAPGERKLRELCDADYRQLHPGTRAVAAAVLAGEPLPDPIGQRDRYQGAMTAARTFLAGQPSARSVRVAARQLTSAVAQLADDMAKEGD